MKSNILIVEDHELTRFGLKTAFEACDFIEKIYEAESAEKGIDIASSNEINLIIMDLGLPGMNGIQATKEIKDLNKDIKIVVLTSHNDEQEVLNSLKAGANAYCSKEINPKRLIQTQILKLITEGYSNIEIAKELFVSINTTKAHVASILQKLEVDDRLQAALKALKERLV